MENYLTLQKAIDDLSSNSPIPNDLSQIATLATYGELSPVVRYNGLLSIDDNDPITANCFITSHELIDLIDDSQSEITLQTAIIYDGAKTGLIQGQAVKLHTPKAYRQSNVLIPEHDITRQLFDDLTDPLAVALDEIATLNARIEQLENELDKASEPKRQRTTPADTDLAKISHQSYRAIDRILYALAQLSGADNSEPFSQNYPSLNAKVTTILENDGLPLGYEAVGKWLSRAKDLKPINKK